MAVRKKVAKKTAKKATAVRKTRAGKQTKVERLKELGAGGAMPAAMNIACDSSC